jgi:hypothetical protein
MASDAPQKTTPCKTLCGTCKWWDHEHILADSTAFPWHRIAKCLWGIDMKLPEWCDGFKGHRYTNEAGTTAVGCATWEGLADG